MSLLSCLAAAIVAGTRLFACTEANAQVKIDISSEEARQAAGETYLEDLVVHDTAILYADYCVKDNALYVPGWSSPADLANNKYTLEGIILRVEVLPGKKLKGNYVDAVQAMHIARGKSDEPSTLTKEVYNKALREKINHLFYGGVWGVATCEEVQKQNPLRPMNLYAIESINGFTKVSDLLASAKKP